MGPGDAIMTIRQQNLHHLQQKVQQLDAQDTELMLQLAQARTTQQSRRLSEELMDVRLRRVVQQAILEEFIAGSENA